MLAFSFDFLMRLRFAGAINEGFASRETSATSDTRPSNSLGISQESGKRISSRHHALARAVSLIRRFVKDFAQNSLENAEHSHSRSSARRVITNGDSFNRIPLVPRSSPNHCRADSSRINVTI